MLGEVRHLQFRTKFVSDHKYRAFHNILRDYKHLKQGKQRTYINGNVHSHRKTKKVFLTTRDIRCVHHDIQVLAIHALACVART